MALRLADRLDTLPGIGPARARGLEKLGLVTVEDLLRKFAEASGEELANDRMMLAN